MTSLLAIDPGPVRSAWVFLVDGLPRDPGYDVNERLVRDLRVMAAVAGNVVIEKVASYGMPVGEEVFETVYWTGRFAQVALPVPVYRIPRKAVVTTLCGSARAKDPNVRQALIDRFGPDAVGRKAKPGPLYGIHGDVWAALAVAVAYSELQSMRGAA